MKIAALVLAAGAGRRAGGPKALLRLGGQTFLERVTSAFRHPVIDRVYAVLGHEADRVRREGGTLAGVILLENPAYATGMLGSVLCGLQAAEADGADAVLVHPVDHPFVDLGTLARVIAGLQEGGVIVVPSWDGRRGHPGSFARAAWDALRAAPADEGARAVLARHPEWVRHVTGDPRCLTGVNTREEYEHLLRNEGE
jgi:CTP:molybdopterin cytidylyltransferase MocA